MASLKLYFFLLICFQFIAFSTNQIEMEDPLTHTLSTKNLSVTISEKGGRVISAKWKGQEVLIQPGFHEINFGSTLWPSPQAVWDWPPPAILDSGIYEVKELKSGLQFTSEPDPTMGLQFIKDFEVYENREAFHITYTIKNVSEARVAVAPWEVTRVPYGGLFFYPAGLDQPRPKGSRSVDYLKLDGVYWFQDVEELPAKSILTISDGGDGWLAYLKSGILFIKTFPDVLPDQTAPGEAEVEFYMDPNLPYVELEQQGVFTNLEPDAVITWEVMWYLREFPDNISNQPGSKGLQRQVRKIISDTK